jgi:hypothetical protein
MEINNLKRSHRGQIKDQEAGNREQIEKLIEQHILEMTEMKMKHENN